MINKIHFPILNNFCKSILPNAILLVFAALIAYSQGYENGVTDKTALSSLSRALGRAGNSVAPSFSSFDIEKSTDSTSACNKV